MTPQKSVSSIGQIVFDFGGVLLDWNPRYLYRKIIKDRNQMESFLTEVCGPQWNEQLDSGKSFDVAVRELIQKYPAYKDLIEAYHHRWDEMLMGEIEGTVQILGELDQAHYPLYAITNWSSEKFHRNKDRFDFLKLFRGIIISGEEKIAKPNPKIFRLLCERYSLHAHESVFIDDVPHNVAAAISLGMIGLVFESHQKLRQDLQTLNILR